MSYPDFTQNNYQMQPQQQMQMNGMQNPYMNAQPWMSQNWGNPYRQTMPMQQPMYNQQPQQMDRTNITNLSGRFVGGQQEIAVNEVDMNGSVSIFPMNDMSCIFAKQWTADGKIQTVTYVPVKEEKPSNGAQDATQPIFDYTPFMERFDRIEQLLTPQKVSTSRAKKGDADNE